MERDVKVLKNLNVDSSVSTMTRQTKMQFNGGKYEDEKAMKIPLIVEAIVATLNLKDLKNCRLVSRAWLKLSTKELVRRYSCCLRFEYRVRTGHFHQSIQNIQWGSSSSLVVSGGHRREGWRTLDNFNEILLARRQNPSTIPSFPCTHFDFPGIDLLSPQIQKFFSIQGPLIKTLSLAPLQPIELWDNNNNNNIGGGIGGIKDRAALEKLLIQQAPNIERLNLRNFDFIWKLWNAHAVHPLPLPCLKSFSGSYPVSSDVMARCSTSYKILTGAMNLEQIDNFRVANVDFILMMPSKIDLIQEYHFENFPHNNPGCVTDTRHLSNVQKFVRVHPTLRKLIVQHHHIEKDDYLSQQWSTQLADGLSQLLQSSRDCLKILQICPLAFLSKVKVPVLQNLKSLILDGIQYDYDDLDDNYDHLQWQQELRIFPVGLDLEKIFPSLTTVTIDFECDVDEFYDKYFPPSPTLQGKFMSVKTLIIRHSCSAYWLQKVHDLFPNLSKLTLRSCYLSDVVRLFPHIFLLWQGSELLTAVEIQIYFKDVSNLDPVLTGMSKEVCDNLLTRTELASTSLERIENVDQLRTRPSISNLSGLKYFDIFVDPRNDTGVTFNPMSQVSHLYAFKFLPNLMVTVAHSQRANFRC